MKVIQWFFMTFIDTIFRRIVLFFFDIDPFWR